MKLFDANEFLTEVVKLQALSPEHAVAKIILLLSDMNGVDAVPVVRCKDCQYCDVYQTEAGSGSILICMIHSFEVVDSNGFCSRGERKDNDL